MRCDDGGPNQLGHAVRKSCRTAEDRLRHARNEEHVDDERDEHHQARDEVRHPHLHRIVAVEGLLDKAVHEPGPDEDESGGNGANHGEADEHIKEVKELCTEVLGHQQRDEDRTEKCRHAVQNEGAAIDDKQNRGCESEHDLHDDVAKDLERCGERRHRRAVAGRLEKLQQVVERTLIEGRDHRLRDVGKEVIDAEARAGERVHPIVFKQAADDEPHTENWLGRPHGHDPDGAGRSCRWCSS